MEVMRAPAVLAAIAFAAALAGCGSSSSSASSASSSSPAPAASSSSGTQGGGTLTLSEKEFKILPAAPTLGHTGKVTITVKNTGAITHALTIDTPSGAVSTSNIAPGATATLTVNLTKSGHYTFFCPIPGHRQAGMVGALIVEPLAHAASGSGSGGAAMSGGSSSSSGY
jgi:plastocyanin